MFLTVERSMATTATPTASAPLPLRFVLFRRFTAAYLWEALSFYLFGMDCGTVLNGFARRPDDWPTWSYYAIWGEA